MKDPEADPHARAVAQRTGETLTQAVINALREGLMPGIARIGRLRV
jgi:hypothetical protein